MNYKNSRTIESQNFEVTLLQPEDLQETQNTQLNSWNVVFLVKSINNSRANQIGLIPYDKTYEPTNTCECIFCKNASRKKMYKMVLFNVDPHTDYEITYPIGRTEPIALGCYFYCESCQQELKPIQEELLSEFPEYAVSSSI